MGASRELIHELRNSLGSILFALELMASGDPVEVAAALEVIERQAGEGEQAAEQLELLETE